MKRLLAIAAAAFLLAAKAPDFTAQKYIAHVKFLASPELKGRGTGTPEGERAARYIVERFKKAHLEPAGENRGYFQAFNVTTNAHLGPKNSLVVHLDGGPRTLAPEKDFIPINFSSSAARSGGVVFAGYGISAPEYHYDDYDGADVKGKFVLILLHEPQENDDKSVFAGKNLTTHAQLAMKAANAKAHGAAGVLMIKDVPTHAQDSERLEKLSTSFGVENAGIPFVQIQSAEAERLLAAAGKNLKDAVAAIDRDLKPQTAALPASVTIDIATDVQRDVATAHNVIGYKPGRTKEYVIIGAHYDHLGLGGPNSLAPDKVGTPHPGADDNASGTAGMLELVRYFGTQPKQERGILFLAFSGEELGLIGSSFYVNHPTLDAKNAVAMINLDMIGRIQNDEVHLSGIGTGTSFRKVIDEVGARHTLKMKVADQGGYGPSDHMSFALNNTPVLFFFSSLHADYHRPSDTWEKIHSAEAARLLEVVADLATNLANGAERPQYVRVAAPPPVSGAGGGNAGYGAYFGSIPDFTEIPKGVKFADVREGSPAAKAGLQRGDILIEFDGVEIQNLMDFTNQLRRKKPGDEVLVKVMRDGKPFEAKVLLAKRS